MRNGFRRTWQLAFVLVLAACTKTQQQPPSQEQIREGIIRQAYARLAQFTQASDASLRATLSDFRHVQSDQFATETFVNHVSPPTGALVDMEVWRSAEAVTASDKNEPARVRYARYVASWTSQETEIDESRYATATVQDAVTEMAKLETTPKSPYVAFTSFTVEVELKGQQRQYRAAFFWHAANEVEEAGDADVHEERLQQSFLVQDQVTVGVANAAIDEALPASPSMAAATPATSSVASADSVTALHARPLVAADVPSCIPSDAVTDRSFKVGDRASAVDNFGAELSARVHCRCNESCYSSLNVDWVAGTCWKRSGCRMVTEVVTDAKSGYVFGLQAGAAGAYAASCAGKNCGRILWLFCSCGDISVTVSLTIPVAANTPFGVSFTYKPATSIWTAKWSETYQCGPCYKDSATQTGSVVASTGSGAWTGGNGQVCGDHVCEGSEDAASCPVDCEKCSALKGDYCSGTSTCPDGYRVLGVSSDCAVCCQSLPAAVCGNGSCDPTEDCGSCAVDCVCIAGTECVGNRCATFCGNGVCDGVESCTTCSTDCICTSNCADDSGCSAGMVCELDTGCVEPTVCVKGCHGNAQCATGEYCDQVQCITCPCPGLCRAQQVTCGDGICASGVEDCGTCASDCLCAKGTRCSNNQCETYCGNGVCEDIETCTSCPQDCSCPSGCTSDAECVSGTVCELGTGCDEPKSCVTGCHNDDQCGADQTCDALMCVTCPCPGRCVDKQKSCGDLGGSYCSSTGSCPVGMVNLGTSYDCSPCCVDRCGDGACEPGVEDCGVCLQDCPCLTGEHCNNRQCISDLPVCGDGVCVSGTENCSNCAKDCGCVTGTACVDNICVTVCNGDVLGTCASATCDGHCGECTCLQACPSCVSVPMSCGSCP